MGNEYAYENYEHVYENRLIRSSHQEVFLRKSVLKICSKLTVGHPCRSVISIEWKSNFTEIELRHGCSPVNLLHIFRTSFPRNTSGWLLLINGYVHSMYLYLNIGVESTDNRQSSDMTNIQKKLSNTIHRF